MTAPKQSSQISPSDEYAGLTTDESTSIATDVSVTFAAYYMGARWEIKSVVLSAED